MCTFASYMDKTRYRYWQLEGCGLCGTTHLRECIGRSVDLNGWTLLLCTDGRATASINFKKQAIRKGDIVFLPYDMHFISLQVSRSFSAEYLSVSMEIADDAFFRIAYSSFWDFLYEHPVQPTTTEQYDLLKQWYRQTEWMLRYGDKKRVAEMLTNNLYNLMNMILMEVEKYQADEMTAQNKNRSWSLIGQFSILVSRYYTRYREVKFYADKLNITPDYLYKLTYRQSGITPKEMIDRQVVTAIKALLSSTDMSIKNIASELNFEDSPYMCRYFRRMTGLSPMEYRNESKHTMIE